MSISVREQVLVPWGHRFAPTDLSLVENFLHSKIAKLPLPHDTIFEFDVYGTDPWNLPDIYGPGDEIDKEEAKKIVEDGYKGYYFVRSSTKRRKQKLRRTVIKSVGTGGGYWKRVNCEHRDVRDERNKLVGFKRTFVFHRYSTDDEKKKKAEKTDWILNEYSLNSKEFQPWVLCSVRNKLEYSEAYFCSDEDEEFSQEDEQITKLIDGVEEVDINNIELHQKQFENADNGDFTEDEKEEEEML